MIDTHCHLDREAFDADRPDVIERAAQAGVTDVVVPAVEPVGWEFLTALCRVNRGLHPALGIHPQALPWLDPRDDVRHLADLEARLGKGGFVAVGECGLDGPTAGGEGHDDGPDRPPFEAPWSRQLAVLAGHLGIARRLGLPVILHSLRAGDAMREILERDGVPSGGVLHSFSGRADQVPALAALGLHFSFAGPVTYERVRKPIQALRAIPRDRLLLETDAPDQTPRPHRGRNEPSFLPVVAEAVGAALGVPASEVDDITTANAHRLFRLGPATARP